MGYIYKITNIINGKLYIGQTKKTIEERFQTHLKNAKNHINRYLYDAMNKYGYNNFIPSLIEECEDNLLDEREIYWIAFYNTTDKKFGYNMTIGGGGGDVWTNNPHKEETSRKISEHNKGKHSIPQELHEKMINLAKEVNTIKIDKENLENDIKSFMPIEDICKKYKMCRKTFYNKCKEFFNMTPTQLRGDRLTHTNTQKIYLDINQINIYLKENKTLKEMAILLNVSEETVRRTIINYYGKNLKEIRKDVKSKNSTA